MDTLPPNARAVPQKSLFASWEFLYTQIHIYSSIEIVVKFGVKGNRQKLKNAPQEAMHRRCIGEAIRAWTGRRLSGEHSLKERDYSHKYEPDNDLFEVLSNGNDSCQLELTRQLVYLGTAAQQ